jgi:mono/diheme cytochrome c family protein
MRSLLLSVCFVIYAFGANAQEDGNAQRGQDFARKVCATCHAIRKGDNFSPNRLAPPFTVIANTSGMTGTALAVVLQSVHENMPNLILSTTDRNDVIAYILSLKDQR